MKTKQAEEPRDLAPTSSGEDGVSVVTGPRGMSSDRMLRRGDAAEVLGTSVSTLRRLEKTVLPPVIDENGVHLQSEQRVLEYKIQRTQVAGRSPGLLDGILASAAFELFDSGSGPVDVVKQFKVEPRVARDLHLEWANLRGSFVVNGAAAAKLERFAWTCDELQIKSGDDVVALIEQIERTECACCERRMPRLCFHCYSSRPARAQKLVATAFAAREARREERHRKELEKRVAERARQPGAGSSDGRTK